MPELIFLGTGASTGVPILSCNCDICKATDPYNKRLRSSVLIRSNSTNVIIDTSPDFRAQCLREKVDHIDAIFLTHSHTDHILGLEDVRSFAFTSNKPIPIYCNLPTLLEIKNIFPHIFEKTKSNSNLPTLNILEVKDVSQVGKLYFSSLQLIHGLSYCTGYKVGNLAYLVDVNFIPQKTMERLWKIENLIIDATQFESHFNHFSVMQVIEVARELHAKKTYITHIDHSISHNRDSEKLPQGFQFAYDGLKIIFSLQE